MRPQGWHVDPSGDHEARWWSAGEPTDLVRDGAVESRDAVRADVDWADPVPVVEPEPIGPADLLRADAVGDDLVGPGARTALDVSAGDGVGGPQ